VSLGFDSGLFIKLGLEIIHARHVIRECGIALASVSGKLRVYQPKLPTGRGSQRDPDTMIIIGSLAKETDRARSLI
jgi:hypothetical protein